MPDQIGNIPVPEVSPAGTLPLTIQFGLVTIIEPKIAVHTFGAGNAKREQRFYLGDPARHFQIDQRCVARTARFQWNSGETRFTPFQVRTAYSEVGGQAGNAANRRLLWRLRSSVGATGHPLEPGATGRARLRRNASFLLQPSSFLRELSRN